MKNTPTHHESADGKIVLDHHEDWTGDCKVSVYRDAAGGYTDSVRMNVTDLISGDFHFSHAWITDREMRRAVALAVKAHALWVVSKLTVWGSP